MKNALFAAGLLAMASAPAIAQPAPQSQPSAQSPAQSSAPQPQVQRFDPDAVRKADVARVGALKAELRLSPEQEKKWPATQAALERYNASRLDNVLKMRDRKPPSDAMAAAEERADNIQSMGAAMRAVLDGIKPLYVVLADDQKARLLQAAGFGGGQAQPRPPGPPPGPGMLPPPPPPQPQPAPPQAGANPPPARK
jgi:hypothetical protein